VVPKKFHKWIHIFGKKTSEWMLTRKLWNHTIDAKEEKGVSVVKRRKRGDA